MISSKIFWHTALDKWLCTSFLFLHAMTLTRQREGNWEKMIPQLELQHTMRTLWGTSVNSAFSKWIQRKAAIISHQTINSLISWMNMLRPRESKWFVPRSQTQLAVDPRLEIKPLILTHPHHSFLFIMLQYLMHVLGLKDTEVQSSAHEVKMWWERPIKPPRVCNTVWLASLLSTPKTLRSDKRCLFQALGVLRVHFGRMRLENCQCKVGYSLNGYKTLSVRNRPYLLNGKARAIF